MPALKKERTVLKKQFSKKLYENPEIITVFGGSGFVGKHLTQRLCQEGYRVRVAVSRPEPAYALKQIGRVGQCEIIYANVLYKEGIKKIIDNSHAVIYLPGTFQNKSGKTYRKLHMEGAHNVAQIAQNFGVPLIHMSALNAAEKAASKFGRSKFYGEKIVTDTHKNAIILRPSFIYGSEDHFFTKIAKIACIPGAFPIIYHAQTQIQPIYVGHVVDFIIEALKGRESSRIKSNKIYELGGPEKLSLCQAIKITLNVIQRQKTLLNLPVSLAKFAGILCNVIRKIPLTPNLYTNDQLNMLKDNWCVSSIAQQEQRTLDIIQPQTIALEAVLASYLWHYRPYGQFTDSSTADWSR